MYIFHSGDYVNFYDTIIKHLLNLMHLPDTLLKTIKQEIISMVYFLCDDILSSGPGGCNSLLRILSKNVA